MPKVKLEKHSRQGTESSEAAVDRKVESPSKNQSRASRPRKRVPVSGFRDILTVLGKDPDYEYRWVKDGDERGQRIWRFQQAAYDFVRDDDVEGIGADYVYKSEDLGSIIRVPAGKNEPGQYLYLMKIPKEFYDEDQAEKEEQVKRKEQLTVREREPGMDDGQYGSGTLTSSLYKH